MSWTGDLLAGIAQHLAGPSGFVDAYGELYVGGGFATWRPNGRYQPADIAPIVISAVPAAPDAVIVLTPYTVEEDPALNDVTQGVQIRTRGTRDPRVLTGLTDDVFDALHGLSSVVLNGVHVVQMYRQSAAYLGVDANGRHEHSSNYYVQAARPSPHRTE